MNVIPGDVWMNDAASVTAVQSCPFITVTSPKMIERDMEVLQTLVTFIEGGSLHVAKTIRYEGGLWIVLSWSQQQADGLIMPTRIIRIDKLPHQEMAAGNHYGVDFVLNDPLPKGLFDRQIAIPQEFEGKFDVVEQPDIKIRPSGSN